MKIFNNTKEVEDITITYLDGRKYFIGNPRVVETGLVLIEHDPDNMSMCEITIHCEALWDNVELIEAGK